MSEATDNKSPEQSLLSEVNLLNDEFQKDTPAYKVIDSIRKFPRPIVVDFNNVIANNQPPLQPNPEAAPSLEDLRKIGNVFIVTTSRDWGKVQEFLSSHDLWSQDIVLMVRGNYDFLCRSFDEQGDLLRDEYIKLAASSGKTINRTQLDGSLTDKRLAPLFAKKWEIPLIDDSDSATRHNPGVFGIEVKKWEPNLDRDLKSFYDMANEGKPGFQEAVSLVKDYYSKIET